MFTPAQPTFIRNTQTPNVWHDTSTTFKPDGSSRGVDSAHNIDNMITKEISSEGDTIPPPQKWVALTHEEQTVHIAPNLMSQHALGSGKFLDMPSTTHAGRGDEFNGDGDEYNRLKKRNFADYSMGHRRMYQGAIMLIGGGETVREANVLEVGTGIGWGLSKMLDDLSINTYVGVEPCSSCLKHVKDEVVGPWLSKKKEATKRLSAKKQALVRSPKLATVFPICATNDENILYVNIVE